MEGVYIMDRTTYIMMFIFLVALFGIGVLVGLPKLPSDSIVNHCNELGYNTAVKQYDTYYCADELIIEDSYRIEE